MAEGTAKLEVFRSATLKDSTWLVEEIKSLNDELDQPREEITRQIQEKEEGDKLVGKSLKDVRKELETTSKEKSDEHGITSLPLLRLKMEVLEDGDGASTLELTGLPRSRNTTLARKLVWDDQVKGTRMRYFADHQQKKMKKKKLVIMPPKRGSIKRSIFSAIFNFMANMIQIRGNYAAVLKKTYYYKQIR